jgi:hypothetical protein
VALAPRVLVHNWRLKLTALGLSVLLWALVQTEPRSAETVPEVPVVLEVSDTSWTPASRGPVPGAVELRLSGPAREIIRLARRGTTVRIPIPEVGSPDTVVVLRRDWVVLGEGTGLSVESFSPASVRVFLERAIVTLVPLAIRTEGTLPPHLALSQTIGLNPSHVRVRGPASRVEELDSVRLRPLALGRVSVSGVFDLPLDTTSLGGLTVEPMSATLGIQVDQKVERRITGVPVIAMAEGDGSTVQVDPTVVSVTLTGAQSLVTAVDPADIRALVAPALIEDLALDETRRVAVRVDGVHSSLITVAVTDEVFVRRVTGPDAPVGPPGPPGARP